MCEANAQQDIEVRNKIDGLTEEEVVEGPGSGSTSMAAFCFARKIPSQHRVKVKIEVLRCRLLSSEWLRDGSGASLEEEAARTRHQEEGAARVGKSRILL